MAKKVDLGLDFHVDKLTNSIENVITGDSFKTDVSIITEKDLKQITKRKGWLFDWKSEISNPERDVYKLTITGNPDIIQGLICIEVKSDNVFVHLIESAPFNLGKTKVYNGVSGNLIAFACRVAFQRGFQGYVSFRSKTNLVSHYIESLGAKLFYGNLMVIETPASLRLTGKYFK